jgi:hypothetical protein
MATAKGALSDPYEIEGRLRDIGYARLLGADTFAFLDSPQAADWQAFADSWNHLGPDLYMADGGRYRRRRHAAFRIVGGIAERKPHQPHYQSRDYNPLNGDIQRWFEPVDVVIAASVITQAVFRRCGSLFTRLSGFPDNHPWHVELHQFRIEATRETLGQPTPEGRHRDGVDWVLVMLIDRQNVAEGVTEIGSPGGEELGRFVLAAPGDAVLLDDHRILHGVTPITAIDPGLPAYRDALVVSFVTEAASN